MSQSNWIVAKFGGTSVSSAESVANMLNIIADYRKQQKPVLVVVSALSGVSNLLEQIVPELNSTTLADILAQVNKLHRDYMQRLPIKDETIDQYVNAQLAELSQLASQCVRAEGLQVAALQAKIMSIGELLSSRILQGYLADSLQKSVGLIDAREWLVSDSHLGHDQTDAYLNAECNPVFSQDAHDRLALHGELVITQGFIARNQRDETVVLGRGGSDTSAAYFAALINAEQLSIWTDVPGMFSANPHAIPEARQLLRLDYREAQEIASTGAKVLHPRCLRPVRNAGVPVFIGSTFTPEKGGTLVGNLQRVEPQVKAISVRQGVTIVAMETADMWRTPGFLAEAFAIFNEQGLSIDQVSTSETNVTITLDNLTQRLDRDRLKQLTDRLSQICRVTVLESCAAVSIVGSSIRTLLAHLSHAFEVFKNKSVHMLTQAANDLNFTFVLDENDAKPLVKQIHNMLIGDDSESPQIGPSWQQLFAAEGDALQADFAPESWWLEQADQLVDIAKQEGAHYVYSRSKVRQQIAALQSLTAVDQIFFAIKANPHPELLRLVEAAGLGFECVSIEEVNHVLNLFPGIEPKRILFTPNFAAKHEYIAGRDLGVNLTFDNLYVLEQWPEVFAGHSVFLRIDTGTGRGHHRHVKTAGKEAKFGIPIESLIEQVDAFKQHQIKVVGLHCHAGSGILTPENWRENGLVLQRLMDHFPDIRYLDLGGGLGIVEQPQQRALDLERVDHSLMQLKLELQTKNQDVQLWLEPGRFVVAESGVLLSRVTQLKGKQGTGYLGVDVGMNSLIRPALYGAYHPIVNISKLDQPATEKVTVVGPICETGDKLGIDRMLPRSDEGDVILIANTGAYGRVMASRYNLREPAPELVID